MKVAKKSPRKRLQGKASPRTTLTLPQHAYRQLDALRGELPRSSYVEQLIGREKRRLDRAAFVELANAQYTEEVCRETLRVNAEFPIHGRP